MRFTADLHIHSKYSRATSRDCDLEHLALWARRKGLAVVGTGDFTHPAWFEEIRSKLVPAEPGLFRLRPEIEREVDSRLPRSCRGATRFMLEVEISTIYKRGEKTRKIHHLIYAPDLDTAGRFRDRLATIGNIASDGRPILGLDSRHLLEITLDSGPGAYLVPAHIWTPWFAVLGSKSGFDSVAECYGDLADHIFAVETGLSSDPPMNWRVSDLDRYTLVSSSDAHSPPMLGREACVFDTELDYFAIRRALETGDGYGGTMEFFPEEGKYHLDGHRGCGQRLEPAETRKLDGRCPDCGKPLTVGVLHRVEILADRPEPAPPAGAAPFCSLVPLPEIMAEICGVGAKSRTVERQVAALVERLGPELEILQRLPTEDLRDTLLAEAIERLRAGRVRCEGGYDGEYGVIKLFAPGEISSHGAVASLFDPPSRAPAPEPAPVPAPNPSAALLDALDPDQRAAAEVEDGPLLIIAGPGTGKTRTLTHRLAHLVLAGVAVPEKCLALTFTRRAAEEMRHRLGELLGAAAERLTVATFHALGLEIVRRYHAELGLDRGFRVASEAQRLALARRLFDLSERAATRFLTALSDRRLTEENAEPDPRDAAYLEALRHDGHVDFDDLLLLPLALFARRPDLVTETRERYRWVLIDEYQDVDARQIRLLRYLVPADGNVCAIGDPDQSIYAFRGADVGFFLRFQTDHPGARVHRLGRNYRSSRTIVAAALQTIAPSTLVPDRELVAMDASDPAPIALHHAASGRGEAEHVVHTIEKLLGGTSYFSLDSGRVDGDALLAELSFDDIAILYRTDAQSKLLIEALERSGIPFQKRSHARLAERPEVRTLVAALEELDRDIAPAEALDRAAATVPDTTAAVELLSPLAKRAPDLETLLAEIALGAEVDTWDPRAERVSLLTLHAAKGLEFPVVFIVGCEDGLLPLRFGGDAGADPEDIDEERRLFFVGLTRARRRLFLSHARRRMIHGKTRPRDPSPFLSEIAQDLLERSEQRTNDKPRQLRLL